MVEFTRLLVDSDLSETALIWAANILLGRSAGDGESGINWLRFRLIAGAGERPSALELVERFGLSLTLVPDDMLVNAGAWALASGNACVWSKGA